MLDAILSQIVSTGKGLARVVSSREGDFLELGESLAELAGRIQKLTADASAMLENTSGAVIFETSERLSAQTASMQELFAANTTETGLDVIATVRESLKQLLELVDSYGRIVRTLQMLGISTRIESARLGADGKGFSTLADDVEKLAHKIVEYSNNIRHHSQQLDGYALEAQLRLKEMDALQRHCSEELFGGVKSNIEQLNAGSEQTEEAARQLVDLSEAVNAQLGQMVSSMQFHDIVRQQVEHVEETLDEAVDVAREELEKNSSIYADRQEQDSDAEACNLSCSVAWLSQVCTLQARQLENGSSSFHEAVEQLRFCMNELAQLVDTVRSVASWDDSQGTGSALHNLSDSITEIAANIASLAEKGGELGSVMVNVVSVVEEMTGFLEDIEDVGDAIELISLNASIRAAHTGEKGRALGVLALSIQRLSQDAGQQTEQISASLNSITSHADNLKVYAEGLLDTSRADTVVEGLQSMMTQLRDAEESSRTSFIALHDEAFRLSQDIEHVAARIDLHDDISSQLGVAVSSLDEIAERVPHDIDEPADIVMPVRLQTILNRYTMEKERAVHHKTLGGEAAGDDDYGVELFDDDDIGDNVELF